MSVTVKQYKDLLEEMKKIYPYKDDKTVMNFLYRMDKRSDTMEVKTKDEETGVMISLSKELIGASENERERNQTINHR